MLQWQVNGPWVSLKADFDMRWAPDPKYIYAALNSPNGSALWDFSFKYRTKTLYQNHGNTYEKPAFDHKAGHEILCT